MKKIIFFIITLLLVTIISIKAFKAGETILKSELEVKEEISKNIKAKNSEFIFRVKSLYEFLNITEEILEKHPYQRNNAGSININTKGLPGNYKITVTIDYTTTLFEEKEIEKFVEDNSKNKMDLDNYQYIKFVNNFITEYASYDKTISNRHSPYTLIKTKKGVCNAYTLLFYKFMETKGIEQDIIRGKIPETNEYHNWNIVKLDDKWYHVDVTHNDQYALNTGFLLKSTDYMLVTRTIDKIDQISLSDFNYKRDYDKVEEPVTTPPVETKHNFSTWASTEGLSAIKNNLVPTNLQSKYQNNITREEFSSLVVRLYEEITNKSAKVSSTNPFMDTTNTDVLKAYNLGIINGVGNNLFAPTKLVTRQEMAVMFNRLFEVANIYVDVRPTSLSFTDSYKVADWAKDSLSILNQLGIINGVGSNQIDPLGNATREQAILLVERTYNLYK